MFKIITLLSALTVSPIMNVHGLSINQNNYNKNFKDILDLSSIKLNDVEVNLNSLKPETSEEDIKWYVLLEIVDQNRQVKELEDIIFDILLNEDEWRIVGLNFEIPQLGRKEEYKPKFIPKSNELYEGFLDFNIKLTNISIENSNDLNNIISEKNLGHIINPNEENILRTLGSANLNVDLDDIMIDLSKTNYNSAYIQSRSGGQYIGSTFVEFTSSVTSQNYKWTSKALSVEAYASTQEDNSKGTIDVHAEFGAKNLMDQLSNVSIKYSGYSTIKDYDGEKKIVYDKEYLGLNLFETKQTNFWDRDYYGSVNWNFSKASVAVKKLDDWTVRFNFDVQVKAYASGWNAWWSNAEAYLKVEEIIFR